MQVGATTDVHVQTGDLQPVGIGQKQAIVELLVPDTVLRLLTAGVGLLAVTMPKARIDPQGDLAAWGQFAQLPDHIGRTTVDVQTMFDTQL